MEMNYFDKILGMLDKIIREQEYLKQELSALKEKQKDTAISMQLNHEETMSELERINANIKSIPPTYEVNEKLLGEHASILSEHHTDIKLIKKMLTNQ